VTIFDPDNWLVSATRSIGFYVANTLNDVDVAVEMSYPDTSAWTKELPLDKVIVHFEQDDVMSPVLGFGIPGVEILDEFDVDNPTVELHEAAQHMIDFNVGVWVSAELGGVTKRMEVVQVLKNIFSTPGGRTRFNNGTEGVQVVSFDGGRNELDRINDLPIWRTLDMTLIVRVFSRYIPPTPDIVATNFDQGQNLTITNEDGELDPVVTP
jgi:hypothetical protein